MTVQKLPGRITQRLLVDEVGQGIGLSYSGQVTPVTESTDPATGQVVYTAGTPVQDQPWLAWTRERDPMGGWRVSSLVMVPRRMGCRG